jgi:hypothetical protein
MTFSRVVLPAPDADAVQRQEFRLRLGRFCGYQSFSVETLLVTALLRALTSASIQVW